MKPELSILISSHDRSALLRRTLYGIAKAPPHFPYEVVLCDDGSTEDVLSVVKEFSAAFAWKFIRVDPARFERDTGIKKFHNSPCWTNNVAFKHCRGEQVFLQGNEVIPWWGCYQRLLRDVPEDTEHYLVVSTTFDMPQQYLDLLDPYGSNLVAGIVQECARWPLQSESYRSDVTNYISLCSRTLWETLGGYDERYYGGISAEDSDFVRRARSLSDFNLVVSQALSLHQFHHGKTCYYNPPAEVISQERWMEGARNNRVFYDDWDGTPLNRQPWPWGELGVVDVQTNIREAA
jgi:glycosyltransferase involved in cell wall biosynthesis